MQPLWELLSFHGIEVKVQAGDLLHMRCDAIVNPSNTSLWLGSGVSEAISTRFGPGLQRELERSSPLSHGNGVVTGAGGLTNCHAIIHVAVIDSDSPDKLVRESVASALTLADDKGFASIAFPALGTGVGTISPAASAQDTLFGIRDFLREREETTLKIITIAAIDGATYTTFDAAIAHVLKRNEPETFPVGARQLPHEATTRRHR